MESFFTELSRPPPNVMVHTCRNFEADTHPQKLLLAYGTYGGGVKVSLLNSIAQAEAYLAQHLDEKADMNEDGSQAFLQAVSEFLFGPDSPALTEKRLLNVQTIGATCGFHLLGHMFVHHLGIRDMYVSSPTWGGHRKIFSTVGMDIKDYPYLDSNTNSVDFAGMLRTLEAIPGRAAVMLHGSCHNPTSYDITTEQWHELAQLLKRKQLFAILDYAYIGFGEGVDQDRKAIRILEQANLEFAVGNTFSKTMNLHPERIGSLHIVTHAPEHATCLLENLQDLILAKYLVPARHGAELATRVLTDPATRTTWFEELEQMRRDIIDVRQRLYDQLQQLQTPGNWESILRGKGVFWFNGFSKQRNQHIIQEWHCYILDSGRITVAGLSTEGVDHLARAVDSAVRQFPDN